MMLMFLWAFWGGASKALVSGVQLLLYRLEKSQYFTIIFLKLYRICIFMAI